MKHNIDSNEPWMLDDIHADPKTASQKESLRGGDALTAKQREQNTH